MAFTPKPFPLNEWLCKTNFSFLNGASHPEEILQAALSLGYSSLCVNDFDGVYGLARAYNDLRHIKKAHPECSLKLNYGAEIHLEKDHDLPVLWQNTLALNVTSWTGYRNLNRLLTETHKDSKNEAVFSLDQLLQADLSGIFAIVPMRGGLKFFLQSPERLLKLNEKLQGELYLAVSKTYHRHSDAWIPQVYEACKVHSLKKVFSQDVFFHHRSQKSFHDVLTTIRTNRSIEQSLNFHLPNGERSLHSHEFFYKAYHNFSDYSETLSLMEELNQQSQFCLSQIRYEYPKEFLPAGETAQSWLEKMAWEGARNVYGSPLSARVTDLIAKELDLIEGLGFADYFLTVWDIVSWARSQNILCQGRGSAANSSVCFALGITSCDPTLFDLLFERFISKERGDPPDIDVDFEHERREEVIQYIYRRYGRGKAAMVANVITFKSKGALRAVGKAFGVKEQDLKKGSKAVSSLLFRGVGLSQVVEHLKNQTGSESLQLPQDFPWHLWAEFARRLQGFPRHLGLHSGGFIISQHAMNELVPQEPASKEGRTVIQWAKDDIEELGFFKIDCLALGMLTALRKGFDLVREAYGKDLSLYKIPQDDPATYSMIQKAKTEGTFQIESRAQMSMLPRLKPRCFYDLVIEIAIIRPGPIQGKVIHPFLRRRDGMEPVTYPDPSVKPILSKTLGVIIFQEQLMRLAIALGDFTPGESDALRKQIGAWNSKGFDRNINPYLNKLLSGMKRRGIPQKFIDQTVEHMKGFSHYGFPESHSISFAFIAYASCYLKCHFPAAFYVSVLNSQPMGFYSPHALLQSALRDGVRVLPICVNHSTWDHQLEPVESSDASRPPVYAIRMGFRLVSGLSASAVEEVVSQRQRQADQKWTSFEEFLKTTTLFRDDYTALAAANAFSSFGMDRFEALWKAEAVPFKPLLDLEERKLQWKKRSSFELAQLDFQSQGTSLQMHPAQQMRERFWNYDFSVKQISLSQQLDDMKPGRSVCVFGLLLVRQAPPSAKGMVFYTLEDETGFLNLAMAPQVYKRFHQILDGSGLLCISGRLQKAGNYHSILVSHVYAPESKKVTALASKRSTDPPTDKPDSSPSLAYNPRSFR